MAQLTCPLASKTCSPYSNQELAAMSPHTKAQRRFRPTRGGRTWQLSPGASGCLVITSGFSWSPLCLTSRQEPCRHDQKAFLGHSAPLQWRKSQQQKLRTECSVAALTMPPPKRPTSSRKQREPAVVGEG